MRAEARIAALEKATAGRPRPLGILCGPIRAGKVETLSDAELELVAHSGPDAQLLERMTDEELRRLIEAQDEETVEAIVEEVREEYGKRTLLIGGTHEN